VEDRHRLGALFLLAQRVGVDDHRVRALEDGLYPSARGMNLPRSDALHTPETSPLRDLAGPAAPSRVRA
jgi:hypothetical protein